MSDYGKNRGRIFQNTEEGEYLSPRQATLAARKYLATYPNVLKILDKIPCNKIYLSMKDDGIAFLFDFSQDDAPSRALLNEYEGYLHCIWGAFIYHDLHRDISFNVITPEETMRLSVATLVWTRDEDLLEKQDLPPLSWQDLFRARPGIKRA